MPTEPIFSKLLLTALLPCYSTVKNDIIILVAMLSVENIFYTSNQDSQQGMLKRRKRVMHKESDHLTFVRVYKAYKKVHKEHSRLEAKKFCHEIGVNEKSIVKAG